MNLAQYAEDVSLTGIDLSPEMLALAETGAKKMGRTIELKKSDAQDLRLQTALSIRLCEVPEEARAISEMRRVLKTWRSPDTSRSRPQRSQAFFWLQRSMNSSVPNQRRIHDSITGTPRDFDIEARERLGGGIV